MKTPPLSLWRIPRVRYDRLVEAGVFGPEDRIELLDGLLVAREPQGARHATVVAFVRAALAKAFGRAYHVREKKPIALDERAGVTDYWVINLIRLLRRNAVVTPLAAPRARIRVAQILP